MRKLLLLAALTLGLALPAHADDGAQAASYTTSTFTAGNTYVLKVKDEYLYLSHGGWYGTQAVAGEFALPFTISASSAGTILNVDYTTANSANTYLYWTETGSNYYVDKSSDTSYTWSLEETTGGYLLKDANDYYMTLGTNEYSEICTYYYLNGTTDSSSATVWELLTTDEYANSLDDMMDAQAATTASLGGLSDISSVSDLSGHTFSYSKDMASYIVNPNLTDSTGGWTASDWGPSTGGQLDFTDFSNYSKYISIDQTGITSSDGSGCVYQKVEDLHPGIYKVSAEAMFTPSNMWNYIKTYVSGLSTLLSLYLTTQKASTLSDDQKAELSTAFLFAFSDSQKSLSQIQANTKSYTYSSSIFSDILGDCKNEFYVYVGDGEPLYLGVAMPGRTPSSIAIYMGWELTYLSDEPCGVAAPVTSITSGSNYIADEIPTTMTATFSNAWTLVDDYLISAIAKLKDNVATITDASGNSIGTASLTYSTNDDGYPVLTADLSSISEFSSGNTYTITIPAGTIGWSDGKYTNDAVSVSFNVVAAAPGAYYIRSGEEGEYQYLSRAGCWGTQALMDDYGLPVRLAYNSDGTSTIQFADNDLYLYLNDFIYTDGSSNITWAIEEKDGGYVFKNKNSSNYDYYVKLDSDNSWKLSESEYSVFALELLSEHKSVLESDKDAQAVEAAAAAGYSVSTKAELAELLANATYFTTTDKTSSLTNTYSTVTESFNSGNSSQAPSWDATTLTPYTFYTESLTLSPGLYKYSVQGFHRLRDNPTTDELLGAHGLVFLNAGDAKTQLLSPFDNAAETAWSSADNCYQVTVGDDAGKYIPNDLTSAPAAFTASAYSNDVYFYVNSSEEVSFSLTNAHNYAWQWMSQWTCWENVTLTQYEPVAIPITITSAGYATLYYGTYNLAVPEGVTAYTASVTRTTATGGFTAALTEVPDKTIPAKTAVILKGDEGKYNFTISSSTVDAISGNDLWGVDETVTYENTDSLYYHLSLNKNKDAGSVGFYWYSSDGHSITCTPHKAFVSLPASGATSSAEAGIRFTFTEDATAISSVAAEETTGAKGTYTLTGLKLDADAQTLPAGVYIIDGKKVLIK